MSIIPSFPPNISSGKLGTLFSSQIKFSTLKICWDRSTLDGPWKCCEEFLSSHIALHNFDAPFDLFGFKWVLKPLNHRRLGTKVSTVVLLRRVNFELSIVILTLSRVLTLRLMGTKGKYQFSSHTLRSSPSFFSCFSLSLDAQPHQHKYRGLSQIVSHSLSLTNSSVPQCLILYVHCKIGHVFQLLIKIISCLSSLYIFLLSLLTSTLLFTFENGVNNFHKNTSN